MRRNIKKYLKNNFYFMDKSKKTKKPVAKKPVVSKSTERKHVPISRHHNHFLTVLVLFAGFSLYALASSVTSTDSYINNVYTDVLGAGDLLVHEDSSVSEQENPFSDLAVDHKAAEAVVTLYYKGIVEGYSDGTFKPDNKVNRAEFSKMLVEAAGLDFTTMDSSSLSSCFNDVGDLPGDWFAPSVCAAKHYGWVKGYEDGGFDPARNINKAEGLKIILKAFKFSIPDNSAVALIPYSDIAPDAWYLGVARAGVDDGIVAAGDSFNASWELTRGDVVEMIYNAMKAKGLM